MATIKKEVKKLYCPECKTTKKDSEFYSSRNLEKFPTGKMVVCKKCRTLMVDNWNKDTFIDILEDCDVPFVAKEWNKLLTNYGQNPEECSGMTILGKYLGKMQLSQYRADRFADSDRLQQEWEDEIKIAMLEQGFDEDTILQAQIDSRKIFPYPGYDPEKPIVAQPKDEEDQSASYNEDGTINNPELLVDYFASEDDVSYDDDLTTEDKKFLRLKWGKTYNTEELIKLERLYREMEASFDIQNAGHRDTLVKVCKTSLKSDQLLDIGDVDGAQKMVKMYEALMKAGKFTAVQNKAEQGECLDSISELTLMCEKQGFIPRYYIPTPNDKVDETIEDLKEYNRDLIGGENNLEAMIEMAVKQIYEDENREEDEDIDDEDISLEDVESIVKDEDFIAFNEFEDENTELSEEAIAKFLKGE